MRTYHFVAALAILGGCVSGGGGTGYSGGVTQKCATEAECNPWQCKCQDSVVVGAVACTNAACATAAVVCPAACKTSNHGTWSGLATGGGKRTGGQPGSCSSTGQICSNTVRCCADLTCSEGRCIPPQNQCAGAGTACSPMSPCCAGLACSDGQCTPTTCVGLSSGCGIEATCCSGLECAAGSCCIGFGSSCESTGCCDGLVCNAGRCN